MRFLIISFLFLVGFIFVNLDELTKFTYNIKGKQNYEASNFSGALDKFHLAENLYNMANSYYKLGKFENSIDLYEGKIDEKKTHVAYHNLGNALYYHSLAEKTSILKRLGILRKSLNAFQKAELLKSSESTSINKAIVEDEIKKLEDALKKSEQEQSKNSQQGESSEGENSNQEEEKNSDEQGDSQDEGGESDAGEQSKEDTSSSGNTQGSGNSEGGLSDEQALAIEKYAKKLEESQGEYGEFYNKIYRENQSEFESIFGNDPFFDNSLLDENNGEKDW